MYNNADKHLKELTDLNQYKSEDDTATEPKGFSDDDLDGFLIGDDGVILVLMTLSSLKKCSHPNAIVNRTNRL